VGLCFLAHFVGGGGGVGVGVPSCCPSETRLPEQHVRTLVQMQYSMQTFVYLAGFVVFSTG
jgi:hypothetical protein